MKNKAPTALVILDGFGYSNKSDDNAIAQAHTPCFDALLTTYPATLLQASGMAVGLPEGSIGNSEVGHLTIGSGSVVLQPFTIIHHAIKDGSFFNNTLLVNNLLSLKKNNGTLHLMRLLSDALVHSHLDHLKTLLKAAQEHGLSDVVVHPFLDGRDVAPQSAKIYLEQLETTLDHLGIGKIGTIHGRFYAMDRNRNWNLTEQSYRTLTEAQPITSKSWRELLQSAYSQNITDEFIQPKQLDPSAIVKDGDGIIFFNFRSDRARQLTSAFLCPPKEMRIEPPKLSFFITPVSYGAQYPTIPLYQKPIIPQTLTQMLHDQGYSLFAVAETEKYAHVTYFFNGGREKKLEREKRVLVPSLSRKDYVVHPEMSADTITEVVLHSLVHDQRDFYVINYANADMIGHTGNFEATVKAIECLDRQLCTLHQEIVQKWGGTLYITGDHGNAEDMFDEEAGQPRTSHTANPVFFIMAQKELKDAPDNLPLEQLSDIAPFIVHNMQHD